MWVDISKSSLSQHVWISMTFQTVSHALKTAHQQHRLNIICENNSVCSRRGHCIVLVRIWKEMASLTKNPLPPCFGAGIVVLWCSPEAPWFVYHWDPPCVDILLAVTLRGSPVIVNFQLLGSQHQLRLLTLGLLAPIGNYVTSYLPNFNIILS